MGKMEKIINERWCDIPGFPGYQVSDLGQVRSFSKRKSGGLIALKNENYTKVGLYRNGIQYFRCVGNLVLLAFVGPKPTGCLVHYRDGDHKNCKLDNLCYARRVLKFL